MKRVNSIIPKVAILKPVKLIPPVDIIHNLDRFDISHPWVQERIHYFAKDTTEKILRNFDNMQISTHRTDPKYQRHKDMYTGNLERSIHWTIVNNAGGDMTLVEFYYLFYGKYLEISASGWLNKKYGPVIPGSIPAMEDKSGVWVETNGMRRPWKAKPFLTSEIRREAKKLCSRLAKQFAYHGGMKIFSTFVTEESVKNGGMTIQECSEGFWDYINNRNKFGEFVENVTLL